MTREAEGTDGKETTVMIGEGETRCQRRVMAGEGGQKVLGEGTGSDGSGGSGNKRCSDKGNEGKGG